MVDNTAKKETFLPSEMGRSILALPYIPVSFYDTFFYAHNTKFTHWRGDYFMKTKSININCAEAKRLEQLLMKSIRANRTLLQNGKNSLEQQEVVRSAMQEKKELLKKIRVLIKDFEEAS
jgi:hypothetical protein